MELHVLPLAAFGLRSLCIRVSHSVYELRPFAEQSIVHSDQRCVVAAEWRELSDVPGSRHLVAKVLNKTASGVLLAVARTDDSGGHQNRKAVLAHNSAAEVILQPQFGDFLVVSLAWDTNERLRPSKDTLPTGPAAAPLLAGLGLLSTSILSPQSLLTERGGGGGPASRWTIDAMNTHVLLALPPGDAADDMTPLSLAKLVARALVSSGHQSIDIAAPALRCATCGLRLRSRAAAHVCSICQCAVLCGACAATPRDPNPSLASRHTAVDCLTRAVLLSGVADRSQCSTCLGPVPSSGIHALGSSSDDDPAAGAAAIAASLLTGNGHNSSYGSGGSDLFSFRQGSKPSLGDGPVVTVRPPSDLWDVVFDEATEGVIRLGRGRDAVTWIAQADAAAGKVCADCGTTYCCEDCAEKHRLEGGSCQLGKAQAVLRRLLSEGLEPSLQSKPLQEQIDSIDPEVLEHVHVVAFRQDCALQAIRVLRHSGWHLSLDVAPPHAPAAVICRWRPPKTPQAAAALVLQAALTGENPVAQPLDFLPPEMALHQPHQPLAELLASPEDILTLAGAGDVSVAATQAASLPTSAAASEAASSSGNSSRFAFAEDGAPAAASAAAVAAAAPVPSSTVTSVTSSGAATPASALTRSRAPSPKPASSSTAASPAKAEKKGKKAGSAAGGPVKTEPVVPATVATAGKDKKDAAASSAASLSPIAILKRPQSAAASQPAATTASAATSNAAAAKPSSAPLPAKDAAAADPADALNDLTFGAESDVGGGGAGLSLVDELLQEIDAEQAAVEAAVAAAEREREREARERERKAKAAAAEAAAARRAILPFAPLPIPSPAPAPLPFPLKPSPTQASSLLKDAWLKQSAASKPAVEEPRAAAVPAPAVPAAASFKLPSFAEFTSTAAAPPASASSASTKGVTKPVASIVTSSGSSSTTAASSYALRSSAASKPLAPLGGVYDDDDEEGGLESYDWQEAKPRRNSKSGVSGQQAGPRPADARMWQQLQQDVDEGGEEEWFDVVSRGAASASSVAAAAAAALGTSSSSWAARAAAAAAAAAASSSSGIAGVTSAAAKSTAATASSAYNATASRSSIASSSALAADAVSSTPKTRYGADDYEYGQYGDYYNDDVTYGDSNGGSAAANKKQKQLQLGPSAIMAGIAAEKAAKKGAAATVPAPAGTGRRAAKAAKKEAEAKKSESIDPTQKALKERIEAACSKDALDVLISLCVHDGSEQGIRFRPMQQLLEVLEKEKICTSEFREKEQKQLVRGVKTGLDHRIIKPTGVSPIQMNAVSFLRRMLDAEGFPVHLFAE